jgi:predicted nucleic acid-binding protein
MAGILPPSSGQSALVRRSRPGRPRRPLAIGLEALPLTLCRLSASAAIRRDHGLLTNDSLNVALLQQAHTNILVTSDPDFDQIPGLRVTNQPMSRGPLDRPTGQR